MTGYIVEEIGEKIRAVRKEKKLKLYELATKVGVSKGLLSKIENSKTVPSLPVLLDIINSLELKVEEFFRGLGKNSFFLFKRSDDRNSIIYPKVDGIHCIHMNHHFSCFGLKAVKIELAGGSTVFLEDGSTYQYVNIEEGHVECRLKQHIIKMEKGDSIALNAILGGQLKNYTKENSTVLIVSFPNEERR